MFFTYNNRNVDGYVDNSKCNIFFRVPCVRKICVDVYIIAIINVYISHLIIILYIIIFGFQSIGGSGIHPLYT